jgi:hypothetical protein
VIKKGKSIKSFFTWLRDQKDRRDPVGILAKGFLRKRKKPGTGEAILNYSQPDDRADLVAAYREFVFLD